MNRIILHSCAREIPKQSQKFEMPFSCPVPGASFGIDEFEFASALLGRQPLQCARLRRTGRLRFRARHDQVLVDGGRAGGQLKAIGDCPSSFGDQKLADELEGNEQEGEDENKEHDGYQNQKEGLLRIHCETKRFRFNVRSLVGFDLLPIRLGLR